MPIKRSKFERSGAKSRSPQPDNPADIPAVPPSPDETQAMAQSGENINRGAALALPMAPEGREQIGEVAQALNDKGGLDSIKAPDDVRGHETAQMIADANPKLQVGHDPNGESWHQGALEGVPVKAVKDQINDLIRKNPTYTIPGQGALSGKPGESFDDFRKRGLSSIQSLMQEIAEQPTAKIGRVTHSQVIRLARGWMANETPDDLNVDPKVMQEEHDSPGSVLRLFPDKDGRWELKEVNIADKSPLLPGGYLIRHGVTPWNKETYEKQNAAQDAASKISQYASALDFGRIRAVATKAAYDKHMSDDQISDTIDAALPSAEQAKDMPLHHIIAIASAASPKRQAEYAPLIQSRMQADGPPDAKAALVKHLEMISLGNQNA